jgi:hypothetical protein
MTMNNRFTYLQDAAPAVAAGAAAAAAASASLLSDANAVAAPSSGTGDWRSTLPDDIRGDPIIKDYKDLTGLVKSHINAQKMIGSDKILKPREDWKPEQWQEFYKSAGRPDKPEDYKLPEMKLPGGVTLDPEKTKAFLKVFHDSGLTQKQTEALIKTYGETVAGDAVAIRAKADTAREQEISQIRTELGDKFDSKLEVARSVVLQFGGEEVQKYLRDSGLGNDPKLVRLFIKVGEAMMEDRPRFGSQPLVRGTAPEAIHEWNSLKSDTNFQSILMNPSHPDHQAAVERRMAVMRRLPQGTK